MTGHDNTERNPLVTDAQPDKAAPWRHMDDVARDRGWPTPNTLRRAADGLALIATGPRYADVLRWVANQCDAPRTDPSDPARDRERADRMEALADTLADRLVTAHDVATMLRADLAQARARADRAESQLASLPRRVTAAMGCARTDDGRCTEHPAAPWVGDTCGQAAEWADALLADPAPPAWTTEGGPE